MNHHRRTIQGQVAMLVFNLVLAERGYEEYKKVVLDHDHYLAILDKSHKL